MPRKRRFAPAGVVQHVFNRGSRKGSLFDDEEDYISFLRLLEEARSVHFVRILAYCLMPNHWHLLLAPEHDNDLSHFMHWLTSTHARRWRQIKNTVGQGAVYQSRFSAVPIEDIWHLLIAWRYIERNPLTAALCSRAEDWQWSSAGRKSDGNHRLLVDQPPFPLPRNWSDILNGDPEWEIDGV